MSPEETWPEGAWTSVASDLPRNGGAYALWLSLPHGAPLPPRFAAFGDLPSGDYLYLGSAYGGGGIAARCRRHLLPEKKRRWHVDWLTTAPAAKVRVWAFVQGRECALVAALLAAGATVPVPKLGSSDCPTCPSHLLTLPAVWPWEERGERAIL